jgi:putative transposase
MIERTNPKLSITRQCNILSISRSSFYHQLKGESEANLELMRRIDELFLKNPFYGSRQMVCQLRRADNCVGRHRASCLMRLMGLAAIYQAPRTSDLQPLRQDELPESMIATGYRNPH